MRKFSEHPKGMEEYIEQAKMSRACSETEDQNDQTFRYKNTCTKGLNVSKSYKTIKTPSRWKRNSRIKHPKPPWISSGKKLTGCHSINQATKPASASNNHQTSNKQTNQRRHKNKHIFVNLCYEQQENRKTNKIAPHTPKKKQDKQTKTSVVSCQAADWYGMAIRGSHCPS